jgi:hypothetical protein
MEEVKCTIGDQLFLGDPERSFKDLGYAQTRGSDSPDNVQTFRDR